MLNLHPLLLVMLGGATAALLDIIFAFVFYGMKGVVPLRILQSISSGLLGKDAYSGGLAIALLGLVLHFFIAITAAFVFYSASLKLAQLRLQPVIAGLIFGIGMYVVMNYIVLPLSVFPSQNSFSFVSLLAHMFLVGLPIALFVKAAHHSRLKTI